MFASQLLRILQTIPSDVKYETCLPDPAKEKMTMKENRNGTLYDSKSLGREADLLPFGAKETYQLNGPRRDTNALVFGVKGRHERWNPFVDDFPVDNNDGTTDSPGKEDKNEHLYHPSTLEEDVDSLSSVTYTKDKVQRSQEHENEPGDSKLPCITASHLFETNKDPYTDKNVLECELPPELIVHYKGVNYHIVKDIGVDEGMPVKDKVVIQSSMDDISDPSFPQPLNDDCHLEETEAGVDLQLLKSDGLEASLLDKCNSISADDRGNNQENDDEPLDQQRPKSPSENFLHESLDHQRPISPSESSVVKSLDQQWAKLPSEYADKDTTQHCVPGYSTGKTMTDVSEEASFVDKTLPFQEFGTRSFLRSFIHSLDGEENKVTQLPDQISSENHASSAEAGPKEDVQASSLYYNSQVESGSITFNFNSSSPVVSVITNEKTEDCEKQSIDSGDLVDQKDAEDNDVSDTKQVACNSSSNTDSTGSVHEKPSNIEDGSSNDFTVQSQVHCGSSSNTSHENVHSQSTDHKDEDCDDLSSEGQVRNSVSSDGQTVEPLELRDSSNDSVIGQVKYDKGESSFSAASLITFSGPVTYSGSLSVRSDGSATSGRSFAFPILQSEWNSSPVRMAEADRRHFRKHKGWRSGLLCCRF